MMRFQIFNCQYARYPVWSKGRCALLVQKHAQRITFKYILIQYIHQRKHFFKKYIKKITKVVTAFAYNVAKFMPKRELIFIHNLAYFRLKNYKKSVNQKIEPHF